MAGRALRVVRSVFANAWLVMLFIALPSVVLPSTASAEDVTELTCSDAWYRSIEEKVPTGDGHGHGPDVGLDEWKSVVEFKLGIRGKPGVPKRDSETWCRHIDGLVKASKDSQAASGEHKASSKLSGPSFSCDRVRFGSIEAMVCKDKELSALDRKLAGVYTAASKKAVNERPPMLKAVQRGWIKGRNKCWKTADKRECVRKKYVRRIAELQAMYRLVPFEGPVFFSCDGKPSNEVVVTFFQTVPATLIAERGDSVSIMFIQSDAGEKIYRGRNEIYWEHQGEALITWSYKAPEMRCVRRP